MLSIGEGIALFGVCGTVITAIIKMVPRNNGRAIDKLKERIVFRDICDERHKNIDKNIEEIKTDLKIVLRHLKI